MNIAINALSAKIGGGIIYLNKLIENLHKIDRQNKYYIFVTTSNRQKIIKFEDKKFKVIEASIYHLGYRIFYEQIIMPFVLKKLKIDILYSPAEIATFLAPCKVVLGIQNLNVYYKIKINRSVSEKFKLWCLRQLARFSFKRVNKMIFVSNTARKDITKKLKIRSTNTRVIRHGVELDKFQKTESKRIPVFIKKILSSDKYILFLSTLCRHKNIKALIRAYAILDKKLRNQYKLLIVGRKFPSYYDELTNLVHQLNLDEKVIFMGEIAFENVPTLYRKAALFVLPSYVETFGIPLIEAMASGIPVIASNVPAIPEIVGDAALLFSPNNPDDLRAKIEQVLSDSKLHGELIQRGLERAKLFSWERSAKETLAVFKEVYEANERKR